MHNEFMNHWGTYLKENYLDIDSMSIRELKEAKCIAETMKEIFMADKEYNIVEAMENHDDYSDVDMKWDEFITRFEKMYNEATTAEKSTMKAEITSVIS